MNLVTFKLILTGVMLDICTRLPLKAGVNNIGRFVFSADNILPIDIKFVIQWPIIGGPSCYVISVVMRTLGLSHVNVTIVYPMFSLGYVVNTFPARYLFGEVLSVQRLIGIAIIPVDILILTRL